MSKQEPKAKGPEAQSQAKPAAKPASKYGKLIAVRVLGAPRANDTLKVGGHLSKEYMPETPEFQIARMERSAAGVLVWYGKQDTATKLVPEAAIVGVTDLKLPAVAYHYELLEGGGE